MCPVGPHAVRRRGPTAPGPVDRVGRQGRRAAPVLAAALPGDVERDAGRARRGPAGRARALGRAQALAAAVGASCSAAASTRRSSPLSPPASASLARSCGRTRRCSPESRSTRAGRSSASPSPWGSSRRPSRSSPRARSGSRSKHVQRWGLPLVGAGALVESAIMNEAVTGGRRCRAGRADR